MMPIQNIAQKRAKYALEKVQKVSGNSEKDRKEWLSRANEMPAMIQMNGLGQTVAFYLSKDGGVHQKMYELLSCWLCEKSGDPTNRQEPNTHTKENKVAIFTHADADLMKAITECDMSTYRLAQIEVQALLVWVKKFSKAYCKE
ncbi:MAG: type III-B CRISPR module-associated protein Cmr5 [Ostreibacterium sp.]